MANASRPPTPSAQEPKSPSGWRFKSLNVPTEWIESYRPGGFHPIHPGDALGPSGEDRYMVVCKLGHGAFSTVWLAQDGRKPNLVAIKVARADARQVGEELRLHRKLAHSDHESDSRKHIVMPIDDFIQSGPNGEHECLVFEPMGPSLAQALEGFPAAHQRNDRMADAASSDEDPPPPPPPSGPASSEEDPPPPPPGTSDSTDLTLSQRKVLLKHLLLGLNCLHHSSIGHGDVNPGNILLCIQPFSSDDVQKIAASCRNYARSPPVRRLDGKQDAWAPRYLCVERPLLDLVNLDHRMLAKISDLGAAFTFDSPPTADQCTTPLALRAPEIILGDSIDEKIDVWSFGCLVYEILTGKLLFQVSGLSDIPEEQNDDDHLLQMIDTLGQPPLEIFERWSRRGRYFDENSQLVRSDVSASDIADGEPFQGPSLEDTFKEAMPEGMTTEEAAHVLKVLRNILRYEPKQRPSTLELLNDQWFQSIE